MHIQEENRTAADLSRFLFEKCHKNGLILPLNVGLKYGIIYGVSLKNEDVTILVSAPGAFDSPASR